ncbi:MAG: hypothetical protein ACXAEU_01360 [Candidatus Hodarchaeales archaeon]|jgi:predicted nucleotidyltransferase
MVIESYFVESKEGIFFDVKGHFQPESWIIAFARYFPENCLSKSFLARGSSRKNNRNGNMYYKFYNVQLRQEIMNSCFPQYIIPDPRCPSTTLQGLPRTAIKQVYDPMNYQPSRDDAVTSIFLEEIENLTGLRIGITGSRLIGLMNDLSDVDATLINSRRKCEYFYNIMAKKLQESSILRSYTLDELSQLYKNREQQIPSSPTVQKELEKPNQGILELDGKEIDFYIRLVDADDDWFYGCSYDELGEVSFYGTIENSQRGIMTPSIYTIKLTENCLLSKKISKKRIYLTSYRGRHSFSLPAGTFVKGRGILEKMYMPMNFTADRTSYRIVIGGLQPGSLEIESE